MRHYFISKTMVFIKQHTDSKKEELEKMKYGLEALYMNLTKISVILILSLILKTLTGTIFFLFFFNNLRAVGFGVHALKSSHCWLFSLLFFIGLPYISYKFIVPFSLIVLIYGFCLIIFWIYVPADTQNRPLINKQKRKKLKLFSLFIAGFYFGLSFIVSNSLVVNLMLFAILLEALLVVPITYKLFNAPYANYLKYKGGD